MDTTQGGGEERKGRREKKFEKDRKISRNKPVWGEGERGRGNILGKQSRAKISWTNTKMQLRKWWEDGGQTCVWFQMKTAPWKSQTTVSCVTGSVAYWLHVTSFQAVSSQSHACNENRCTADKFNAKTFKPTNKQTNTAGWEAADAHFSVNRQTADNVFVHRWEVSKL